MKNYEKIGGKICFGQDIDVFIRMHKLINLQNSVNNELKWLQSQSLKGVPEILENIILYYWKEETMYVMKK